MTLVIVLAFVIYCGMTLITYEWSKEVASAYSWAAFHRKAYKRAEGIGMGWISFFDPEDIKPVLGIPENIKIIAYLAVGYLNEEIHCCSI